MAYSDSNALFAKILLTFDINAKQPFNYEKFQTLCVRIFSEDEVEQNELRVREIFELFDANADGVLSNEELYSKLKTDLETLVVSQLITSSDTAIVIKIKSQIINILSFRKCCMWIHTIMNPITVLLVVDVQNDFIDGTLALRKFGQEGLEVVEPINWLLREGHWDEVIYIQDWHPKNHISFFENLAMRELHPTSEVTKETAKPFDTVVFLQPHVTQVLWPRHCVKNTWGAELHKDLLILPSSKRLYKGQDPDKESYSAFEKDAQGFIKLEEILLAVGATLLFVCGLTYDICVKETCLDGLRLGYPVAVIKDCCRSTKPDEIMTESYIENGALVAHSDRILSMVNEHKHSLVMAHHAAKNISKLNF